MAFDSEEFKRRRAQREAIRRQKAAKAKRNRLFFVLGGVGALAILVAALIFLLPKTDSQPDPSQTTLPPPDTTVIHFAAAGDLNVTQADIDAGDYTAMLMDVVPLLSQADITTLNFEGGFYGAPSGESASAPEALGQALVDAGVDLLQLANSYTIWGGTAGLTATLQQVKALGLTPVGAYSTPQEAKQSGGYTIREVNGVKIAFVAFTKGFAAVAKEMNGMTLPPGSEGCVNLLYTDYASSYQEVDTEGISKVLSAVAKEKPDVTVAMVHWGSEFTDPISVSQEEIRDLMLANGVDAILGTHSHFVQKMEFDAEKGTFVAYSLGDFLSDDPRPGTEYSVVLDLEITKNHDTGSTQITNYTYTPIFTVTEENSRRVVRLQTAMDAYNSGYIDRVSEETYGKMQYALDRIEARIKGE